MKLWFYMISNLIIKINGVEYLKIEGGPSLKQGHIIELNLKEGDRVTFETGTTTYSAYIKKIQVLYTLVNKPEMIYPTAL